MTRLESRRENGAVAHHPQGFGRGDTRGSSFASRLLLVVSLGLLLGAAPVPPLTVEQDILVRDGAVDGRDGVDAALPALLENLRLWPADPDDRGVLIDPDWSQVLENPERFRTMRMRLSGVLQQRTPRPELGAEEWFVRDVEGCVIRALVVAPAPRRVGERVALGGRFHKRLDAVDRLGALQSYPALVARERRRAPAAAPAASRPGGAILIVGVIVMAGFFLLLRRIARRPNREPSRRSGWPGPVDAEGCLPDDPAEALAELRQRHDDLRGDSDSDPDCFDAADRSDDADHL